MRDRATGRVLWEGAAPLGKASNNVAEYSGLIAGPAGRPADRRRRRRPGADGLQARRRADGRPLEDQARRTCAASRSRPATSRPQISAAGGSVSFSGSRASRTRTRTPCPTTAWTGVTIEQAAGRSRRPRDTERRRGRRRGDRPRTLRHGRPRGLGPDIGTPTRILLVRHGVTDFTAAARLDGRGGADPSLNTAGRAQAAAAGRATAHLLGGRRPAWSPPRWPGPSRPAPLSAEAIGLIAEVDPDWDEQDFGDWDGASSRRPGARRPRRAARPAQRPCIRPARGRDPRRAGRARAGGLRPVRRGRRHDRRGLPPQADHDASSRTCWGCRTRRSGAWRPHPGRSRPSRCGRTATPRWPSPTAPDRGAWLAQHVVHDVAAPSRHVALAYPCGMDERSDTAS